MPDVSQPDPDSKEPVMGVASIGTIIGAGLTVAVAFGVDINDPRAKAVAGFILIAGPLILGWFARRKAYSPATVARMLKQRHP